MARRRFPGWSLLLTTAALSIASPSGAADTARTNAWSDIASDGRARVIVRFAGDEVRTARLPRVVRRARTRRATRRLIADLAGTRFTLRRSFDALPAVALEVDASGLARLERSPDVAGIFEDREHAPALHETTASVQAMATWAVGVRGAGQVVAVLDTGVDTDHPFLRDAIVEEACFSQSGDCPDGTTRQTGPGSAAPCTFSEGACAHGTHVAGIVAGRDGDAFGIAPEAGLVAIQVFSRSTNCRDGEQVPCPRTFSSDYIGALEHVLRLSGTHPIAAVNLSFAGGTYGSISECNERNPLAREAIAQLRSAGIATVVAAGNSGSASGMGSPACLSPAISVGSVDPDGRISSFSNHAWFLDLMAPGRSVRSAVPGGRFSRKSGTSMAAPVVAGAWALLRQTDPGAPVDVIHSALAITGDPIEDAKNASFVPFVDVRAAHDYLSGACPCSDDLQSFCDYPLDVCRMTAPGGYCDPDGDGDFADADWARGWDEFQTACRTPLPEPDRASGAAWLSRPRNAPGAGVTRGVAANQREEGRR